MRTGVRVLLVQPRRGSVAVVRRSRHLDETDRPTRFRPCWDQGRKLHPALPERHVGPTEGDVFVPASIWVLYTPGVHTDLFDDYGFMGVVLYGQ